MELLTIASLASCRQNSGIRKKVVLKGVVPLPYERIDVKVGASWWAPPWIIGPTLNTSAVGSPGCRMWGTCRGPMVHRRRVVMQVLVPLPTCVVCPLSLGREENTPRIAEDPVFPESLISPPSEPFTLQGSKLPPMENLNLHLLVLHLRPRENRVLAKVAMILLSRELSSPVSASFLVVFVVPCAVDERQVPPTVRPMLVRIIRLTLRLTTVTSLLLLTRLTRVSNMWTELLL